MVAAQQQDRKRGLIAIMAGPPWKCFAPLMPILLGVVVGILFHYWLGKPNAPTKLLFYDYLGWPQPTNLAEVVDAGCRCLTFFFCLTFWLLTALGARRCWNCGGTSKTKLANEQTWCYTVAFFLWLVFNIGAMWLLSAGLLDAFILAVFVMFVLAVREIGWGTVTGVVAR